MLTFPNQSRSYDQARDGIKFWGHDGTLEVPFFLELNTLFRISPKTRNTEEGVVAAFDASIERIHDAASRAYARGKRSFYVLGPDSL
jgi:hypothetical protein